ncbi:MAG: hypothetical protein HY327_11220 [Chloroflexi bacterium]|nr:hypothetical protein [Chloroflexota bacterium]
MKGFFLKCLWLVFLVAATNWGLISIINNGKNSGVNGYLGAIQDKEIRLAATPSPKIIFVGGSNIALGLDSERVEKEVQMPVVNMGLNAGLGLRFMLNQVKPQIKAGDLIVIIPEYEQFYTHLSGGTTLVEVLALHPPAFAYLDTLEQYGVVLREYPAFIQGVGRVIGENLDARDHFVINRQSYNRYGDIVAYLGRESIGDVAHQTLFAPGQTLEFQTRAVDYLNEFIDFSHSRRANVLVLFPPIPDIQYGQSQIAIDTVYQRLKAGLNIPVVSTPVQFVFPVAFFYDTVYHLNAEGRNARTTRVISEIRQSIASR